MHRRTGTTLRRFSGAVVAALIAVTACSGGDDETADTAPSEQAPDAASVGTPDADDSNPSGDDEADDDAEADTPVDVPTVSELTECGAPDHPCSWEDADDDVFDHSLSLGEAATAAYVDGASLIEVAEQLAGDDRIASVLVSNDAVSYRVDGGLAMWILADGAVGERSAPAPFPEYERTVDQTVTEPFRRDVVGDDPESKRALVISPYQFDFGVYDEGAAVAALYAGARGYDGNVDYFANTSSTEEVGVDQFANWGDYDVVHVSTHGTQQCDDSGCTTILLVGKKYTSKEVLLGDNGGSTVVFSRFGRTVGVWDSFMNRVYPGGLPDTVVVLSACETGRGADLTDSFGDGVVFSWTEPVASDFAGASSIALHRTLIETGSTTERAHQVVSAAGLSTYDKTVDPEAPTEPGSTLVLGSDGTFHEVSGARVGGSEATDDGNGPVIENLDTPEPDDTQGETITVTLVRRGGGSSDLRVREVAWIDHPQTGGEMQPGAEVRVDIREDADYLPVALRVEGIDPGDEGATTLRLEVDGVELDSWTAAQGTATGKWGEYLIEDDVRLLNRIEEDEEIEMKLIIDLPEDGESVDEVGPVTLTCLTGIWRLRSQAFLDEITRVAGQGQGIGITHRSGEYRITLRDDGTYLGERDQWQFSLNSPQGALVTTIDSADPGTWTSTGNNITISEPGSTATVSLQVEVGGQLQAIPLGAGNQSVAGDAISGTGTFTCEDEVLTTTYEGVTAEFDYMGPAT